MKLNSNDYPQPLNILFLEDLEQDVVLMSRELDKEGFKFIAKQVATKKDFLDALQNFNPHLIIADYSLPMFNGMHAFRLFKEQKLMIPFILATGSLSEELALECMNEGVDDFILKSSFNRLPNIVSRNLVLKEKERESLLISTELKKSKEELDSAKIHELLSNREFEILCLIAAGKSVKEIASELFISPATVATYRSRILDKLLLKSNVDLTRYAIKHNLID
ncbi:MAG: hybrid sensor histidine kinase/response regulator [Bacteroidota bacterium]|nr:hybrid sensor histidine kinase/response regulator [Bacteroidota bacterium]